MVPTETESDHVRVPGLHISGENRHHTYCSKTTIAINPYNHLAVVFECE